MTAESTERRFFTFFQNSHFSLSRDISFGCLGMTAFWGDVSSDFLERHQPRKKSSPRRFSSSCLNPPMAILFVRAKSTQAHIQTTQERIPIRVRSEGYTEPIVFLAATVSIHRCLLPAANGTNQRNFWPLVHDEVPE